MLWTIQVPSLISMEADEVGGSFEGEGTVGHSTPAAATAGTVVINTVVKVSLRDGSGDCCTNLMMAMACLHPVKSETRDWTDRDIHYAFITLTSSHLPTLIFRMRLLEI